MPPPLHHYRTHGLTLRPCGALWSLPSPLDRSQIQSPIPVPKFPFFHSPSFFYRGRHFGIGGLETPQGSRAKPARCLSWLRFGNKVLCGQLGRCTVLGPFQSRMNLRVQVGYYVDIIELGICHIEIHFGIAPQFVIYNESVFNSLHSHQKYVVSLYFCLPNTKFNSSKCRDRISSCRE